MPTIQVKAQVSSEDLLQAVKQLEPSELDGFVLQVLSLRAHRKAPGLTKTEAELLLTINRGVPSDIQKRYDHLIGKRRAENLLPAEYDELLQLTDQVERLDAERMEALAALAGIRETSLTALMKQLQIPAPAYD